jgi:hypothetical protein
MMKVKAVVPMAEEVGEEKQGEEEKKKKNTFARAGPAHRC